MVGSVTMMDGFTMTRKRLRDKIIIFTVFIFEGKIKNGSKFTNEKNLYKKLYRLNLSIKSQNLFLFL